MSSALTRAIYERLTGIEKLTGCFGEAQAQLATLLASDPNKGNKPAARFGDLSDYTLYPCVTYRPGGGTTDLRFTRPEIQIDHPIYDFEVWGLNRSAFEVTDIAERVDLLIDQRFGAPPLPVSTGFAYRARCLMPVTLIPDTKRRAWCGLTRYQFILRR